MLMKLTPGVNFINILIRVFCTKFWCQKLQSWVLGLKFSGTKILYKNRSCKLLMKLTAGVIFTNIFFKAFKHEDHKIVNNTDDLTFCLQFS